jgi:hypothetical protein
MICLPKAGKKMDSIPMIIWKMIEILLTFQAMGSQWKNGLDTDLGLQKWRERVASSFPWKVGFRNIKESNWKSPSGFQLFFLPYRVSLNPSFFQPCLESLSSRI